MNIFRGIGLLGFALYVIVCGLLIWRLVTGDSLIYFGGNTLAAAMVLTSNLGEFNMALVLIQIFFITIGMSAMILRFLEDTTRPQVD